MCFNLQWAALIPDGLTPYLVLAIFSSVLGMVQFGYNTGCMNTPEDVFRSFLNQSYYHRWGKELSSDGMDLLWSTTVSIFAIGGMLGGLCGFVADLCGRKCGLLLNNVFAIVGATLLSSSKYFRSFECLILGRFIIGLNCGLNTTLVPMYISEISPINLRGSLGTISQLGVTIGLLLSQILGLPSVLGTNANWPTLLGIAFVPAILQLVTLPFSAESPRYLYFNDRHSEAKAALQRFRCRRNVDEDLEEMRQEQQSKNEKTMTILQLLSSSSLRMPLIIAVVMQLSQQLSGINAIFYYSTDVFIKAGLDKSVAKASTMAVGLTMVIMTIVSVPLMDRAGRRTLHLWGLGGMFLTSIFLTISLLVRFIYQSMSLVSVVSSLLFTLFFAIGPGSIPWLITAELFSQGPRPAAISIAVLVNWSTNFIVGLVFPLMNRVFESYSFLPFTVFIAIFWTFTYHRVPETKNRTFDEIAALFKIIRDDSQLDEGSVVDYPGGVFEEPSTMSNGVMTKGVSFSPQQAGFHIHHFHQPALVVPTQPHTFNYNYLDLSNQLDFHHSHHALAGASAMPTHPAPVAYSSHPALHNQAIISPHSLQPHTLQAHQHSIMISPNILASPTSLMPSSSKSIGLQQPTSQTLIPVRSVHPTAQSLPIAHASSHGILTMSGSPPLFQPSPTALKPILHTGKHHKSKKRSLAKATIDDQCLMANHQIEDQL